MKVGGLLENFEIFSIEKIEGNLRGAMDPCPLLFCHR